MRAARSLAAAALGLAVLLSLVAGLLLSRQTETEDGVCGSAIAWHDPRARLRGGEVSPEEQRRLAAACHTEAVRLVDEALAWLQLAGIATVVAGALSVADAVARRRRNDVRSATSPSP